MRGKSITIYMKNEKYGKSLAKGLCYIDTGLEIFLADSLEKAMEGTKEGILLTDYDVNNCERVIKISNEEKLKPIDYLMEKIRVAMKKIYKIELCLRQRNTKIFGIYSRFGGQGVTSFAITLARILSIKTDKPVLYLSLDNIDDSYRYIDFKGCFKYSKEEYFFMKEEMLIASLKDYLMVDRWGVNYYISDRTENFFSSGYAKDKIIDYIKNDSYFDYVIIDFGKKHCLSYKWLDKKIEIERENFAQDLSRERDEDVLRIINFSEFADGNNGYYYIKKCIENFIQYDENIEISMEGEYAQCVEKYIDINKLTFDCYDKRLQIMSEEKA